MTFPSLNSRSLVVLKQTPPGFRQVLSIPCSSKLVYNTPGSCYSVLEIDLHGEDEETEDEADYSQLLASLENVSLKFKVKDCDPNTGEVDEDEVGYDDEYRVEDVDVVISDFFQKIVKPDFNTAWEEIEESNEVEEVYQLTSFKSIEEAVKNVVAFMGMHPCDRSDRVSSSSDGRKLPSHTLFLSGVFRGKTEVLIRAKLAINLNDPDTGVTMKISVRSNDLTVSNFVAASVV